MRAKIQAVLLVLALSMTGRTYAQSTFSLSASRVTVTGSATAIVVGTSSGIPVTIKNPGATTVYLGASDVTTSTGFQLLTGDSLSVVVRDGQTVYGITSGSSQSVQLIEGLQSAKFNANPAGAAGVGSVTNVATSGLLSGGPITTTGTISCPSCASTSANVSQFATTNSATFAGTINNETGFDGVNGVLVFNQGPTLVAPILGTPASVNLSNGTALPLSAVTGLGTGVATALATPSSANLASAVTDETGSGALVFGTAPTITLANGSGLPIGTGVSGLAAGVASFLATPTSANLATAVTNETGSGSLVFGTAPTITLANGTGLPVSTGISGLGTNVATALATPSSSNVAAAVTDETGSGALVFGTAPTITLANGTGLPISTGVSGLAANVATFLATPSSSNLISAVTDETGSGALVFGTAPTITLANGTGLPVSTGISGLGTGVATFLATPSSANLASALTDETGGSGVAVFASSPTIATPTFTTNITDPLVIGGTGTGSTLTLQPTSGVGAAGADLIFNVGNAGATRAGRIANSAFWQIGVTSASASYGTQPTNQLHIVGTANSDITGDHITADTVPFAIIGRKARGTVDSPTQALANDNLVQIIGQGWETTTPGWSSAANAVIGIQATENFTSAAQGTKMIVNLTPTGSITAARALTISAAGMIFSQVSGTAMAVANVGANSCGTSTATIAGNQSVGEVTVGATSGTQCRVAVPQATTTRFNGACSNQTTANLCRLVAVDTTHFDLVGVFAAGDVVAYSVASR